MCLLPVLCYVLHMLFVNSFTHSSLRLRMQEPRKESSAAAAAAGTDDGDETERLAERRSNFSSKRATGQTSGF